MRRIGGVLRELSGLFVDDGRFALSIVVWIGVVWLLLPRLGLGPAWEGVVLFTGLAAILLESAWRQAG
ncbi:MAG TPA: hypothetical protein VMF62_08760 [Acetobacteraceae bacterium]|nr:hypothetical protein [Acetobacteraceae bacterium]